MLDLSGVDNIIEFQEFILIPLYVNDTTCSTQNSGAFHPRHSSFSHFLSGNHRSFHWIYKLYILFVIPSNPQVRF